MRVTGFSRNQTAMPSAPPRRSGCAKCCSSVKPSNRHERTPVMAKNGFKLIDAEMHVMEPVDLWQRYIDPEFRARAPRRLDERAVWFLEKPVTLVLGEHAAGTFALSSRARSWR